MPYVSTDTDQDVVVVLPAKPNTHLVADTFAVELRLGDEGSDHDNGTIRVWSDGTVQFTHPDYHQGVAEYSVYALVRKADKKLKKLRRKGNGC